MERAERSREAKGLQRAAEGRQRDAGEEIAQHLLFRRRVGHRMSLLQIEYESAAWLFLLSLNHVL